jgi:hypothetical protein
LGLGEFWYRPNRMTNSYGFSIPTGPNENWVPHAPNRHPGCTIYINGITWTTGGNPAFATGGTTSGWTEYWWKPVCKLVAPFTMRL